MATYLEKYFHTPMTLVLSGSEIHLRTKHINYVTEVEIYLDIMDGTLRMTFRKKCSLELLEC